MGQSSARPTILHRSQTKVNTVNYLFSPQCQRRPASGTRSRRSTGAINCREQILRQPFRNEGCVMLSDCPSGEFVPGSKGNLRQEVKVPLHDPYVIAMLYAASRSGKQSEGCRSSLSPAGFTLMWNDARSSASFGPITLVNLSTVVLKFLACICCNSIVMVMSNNPRSRS
jgi:hypothetical protein